MRIFQLLFISLLVLHFAVVKCQTRFHKKYHIAHYNDNNSILSLSNGNFILTCMTGTMSNKLNLTELDSNGNITWSMTDTSGLNAGWFPIQISDSNIIITGTSGYGINGGILLLKINSSGNTIWAKSIGGNLSDGSNNAAVVETYDNSLAVAGVTNSFGAGNYDCYLIKTDASGNLLWAKSYGGPDNEQNSSLIETKDHGFIVLGSTQSFNAASADILVVKTDSAGNVQWSKMYGRPNNELPFAIVETPDNGYLLSGSTGSASNLFILKIDSSGSIEWAKTYKNFEEGLFCRLLPSDEIIVSGTILDSATMNLAPCLLKADSSGNVIWNRVYDQEYTGVIFSLTPGNGFVLTGTGGNYDTLLVIKTDSTGSSGCNEGAINMTVTSPIFTEVTVSPAVDSGGVSVNAVLTWTAVSPYPVAACTPNSVDNITYPVRDDMLLYPNPAKDEVIIFSKGFTGNTQVSVKIYELSGRIMMDEKLSFSANRVHLNLKNFNSGLYTISVNTAEKAVTRKLPVIK